MPEITFIPSLIIFLICLNVLVMVNIQKDIEEEDASQITPCRQILNIST